MSSSSPPHPQYSLGKPLILRNCFLLKPETPPKYPAYGNLKEKRSSQTQTVHNQQKYYFQGMLQKQVLKRKGQDLFDFCSQKQNVKVNWWYCWGLNNNSFPKRLWFSPFYLEKQSVEVARQVALLPHSSSIYRLKENKCILTSTTTTLLRKTPFRIKTLKVNY